MSDQGIFILETKGPEFRVTFADSTIENIFGEFDKDRGIWKGDPEAIQEFFGERPFYSDKELAVNAAMMLLPKSNISESEEFEFGVCNIVDFKDKSFEELIS